MAKRKLRMLLSYILMFVVFNALSDGQASQIVGDTLNRETASVAPAPGVATPSGSSPDSQTVTCIGNQLKISTNNSTLAPPRVEYSITWVPVRPVKFSPHYSRQPASTTSSDIPRRTLPKSRRFSLWLVRTMHLPGLFRTTP